MNDKYVANLKNFAELETYAAKYKLERDAEGNLVRDAAKVDKIVADAKVAAYKAAEWTGLTAAQNAIRDNCNCLLYTSYIHLIILNFHPVKLQ